MRFKTFQREDLSLAALHDGLILGQDTGLGKTIAAYVWPLLKVGLLRNPDGSAVRAITPAEPVLIIASGDLHEHIFMEARLRAKNVRLSILKHGEKPGRQDEHNLETCTIDFTLKELVDHFIITDVPDVARINPEGYQRNLQLLLEIEPIAA